VISCAVSLIAAEHDDRVVLHSEPASGVSNTASGILVLVPSRTRADLIGDLSDPDRPCTEDWIERERTA
jgi:hypothetical protein